jgi:uncharacterized protein YbdZ (MbtH family)
VARKDLLDLYRVLINAEQQYGILPVSVCLPNGWVPVGMEGTLDECKTWVDDEWHDMRPLGLRQVHEASGIKAA